MAGVDPDKAFLVQTSGALTGLRYPLEGEIVRIGRGPSNDIIVQDIGSAVVSTKHVEIRKEGPAYRIYDLESTNGTFVNGERVKEVELQAPCSIRLGVGGPEFTFVLGDLPNVDLNKTLVASPISVPFTGETAIPKEHEKLLAEAITRARVARKAGAGNQTTVIMRQMLGDALHRTGRKFRIAIAVLVSILLLVTAYGWWTIHSLRQSKTEIDAQIRVLEIKLRDADPEEADRLAAAVGRYEERAEALQRNAFYRIGIREQESFLRREIRTLLAEFGAESYSIPSEFTEAVNRYLQNYNGPERKHLTKVLGEARPVFERMRRIFLDSNLPPDFVYMVLVETGFDETQTSPVGAAGLWQFTPATAKAYGLQVTDDVDERLHADKATQAACRFIRDLILEFGAGSSVMLAMAAYNVGPAKVKQAVRRVPDPIKQRNFWYLYRVRALPLETREYVPRVIAAMIIGRNPERFGF